MCKVNKTNMSFLTDAYYYSAALRDVKVHIVHPGDVGDDFTHKLLSDYTQLRTDYVLQEKWPIDASGVDIDTYDSAAPTYYVIAYSDSTKNVLAGLRLTRVSNLLGSLSYDMWKNAFQKEQFLIDMYKARETLAVLDKAGGQGELWDVTRLITRIAVDGKYDRKEKVASKIAIVRLLGGALKVTGANAWWLFTVGEKLRKFMERNHLVAQDLSKAHISEHDREPAFFSVAHANHALDHLRLNNRPAHNLVVKSKVTHSYRADYE